MPFAVLRIVGLVLVLASISSSWVLAWTDPLSPEERRGRLLYHRGMLEGESEVRATVQGDDHSRPAALFRCVQCHGVHGEGLQEGGVRAPSLVRSALAAPRSSGQAGYPRPAYSRETLLRAMTQGFDPGGRMLDARMPHYEMTAAQLAALAAYLDRIGEDADTDIGVSPNEILIGAALPLSGPFTQIGQDAQAILAGYFSRLNADGGIYGRQVKLIVEDSRGEPTQTAAVTAKLIAHHRVFALVGSFEPSGDTGTRELLQQYEVPSIGSLALSPQASPSPHRYLFYSLPGFDLQFRSLIDFIADRAAALTGTDSPNVALIYSETADNLAILERLRAQIEARRMKAVSDQAYRPGRLDAGVVAECVEQVSADVVLFLGNGEDLSAVQQALNKQGHAPLVFSSASMIGVQARRLDPAQAAQVYLAAGLPMPTAEEAAHLRTLARPKAIVSVGFARMAHVAAAMSVEALKRVGRRLDRTALVEALESFHDQNVQEGVAVTFGPHRRVGSSRSIILRAGQDPPHDMIPIAEWSLPSSIP